jgi:uncharacterized protein YdhG (YjbR/CyaY superfamily)
MAVDAYLAAIPEEQREALERIRARVARLVPDAEATISYGMPALKLKGHALIWFAAWKKHCSVYPLTDTFLRAHADELRAFRRTKGSLHFTPDAPLPEALLDDFIRARIADVTGSDS